jgi:DNA-binding NarL/FixJ family response regulator
MQQQTTKFLLNPPAEIIIYDKHEVYLHALGDWLAESLKNMRVVKRCCDRQQIVSVFKDTPADLLLIGFTLLAADETLALIDEILKVRFIKIIALSSDHSQRVQVELFRRRVRGYIIQTAAPNEILSVIEKVHQNTEGICKNYQWVLK